MKLENGGKVEMYQMIVNFDGEITNFRHFLAKFDTRKKEDSLLLENLNFRQFKNSKTQKNISCVSFHLQERRYSNVFLYRTRQVPPEV